MAFCAACSQATLAGTSRRRQNWRIQFFTTTAPSPSKVPEVWKRQLVFQTYRLGAPALKPNVLTITQDGKEREFQDPVISIGRVDGNDLVLSDNNVSRQHCLIVNYLNDIWIYDLGSTQGVFVDGKRIDRKVYLNGVHSVKLGQTELVVCSKLGLLV